MCLIPVGRVVKAHGIRGEVKIVPYGETLGGLGPGEKLVPASPSGNMEPAITLVSLRSHKNAFIGRFDLIGDIDQAQALAGKELFIPKDRLPPLPDGEYYQFQLIGLAVQTRDGTDLGTLRSIMETGSNDVYVVEGAEKELLVPAIEDVILEIDLEKGKIIVELPEGLE